MSVRDQGERRKRSKQQKGREADQRRTSRERGKGMLRKWKEKGSGDEGRQGSKEKREKCRVR